MSKKDIFTKRNINLNGKPAIFYGDISRKYDCFAQEVINRIDDESYEKATKVEKGQILVNLEDFDDNDIGRCVLYQNAKGAAVNGNVAILSLKDTFKDIIDLRYISFYLNYKDTVIDFENILITIPNLEVQNRITDNFIELKRKFENDITELEEKIKIIDENSKVYMDHIFKFN